MVYISIPVLVWAMTGGSLRDTDQSALLLACCEQDCKIFSSESLLLVGQIDLFVHSAPGQEDPRLRNRKYSWKAGGADSRLE
eukprot:6188529-Pleurochrysis_carterae.AAC.1